MPPSGTVILSCVGYRASWWQTVAFWLLVVVSGGIFRLCVLPFPQLRKLLLTKCTLPTAQYVHVQLVDGRRKFVRVHYHKVLALPKQNQVTSNETGCQPVKLQSIVLFLRPYEYSRQQGTFVACPPMPLHIPRQICQALGDLYLIDQGGDWIHFNECHSARRSNMALIYGSKRSLYDIRELRNPASRHVMLPVTVIQYLECIYLICRGYWIFPVLVAILSLLGSAGLVWTICRQHKLMSGMLNRAGIVPIVRRGWVKAMPAWKLVPGDIVVLQRGKATCDLVLLKGSCLVEESMLSGEAAQVRKSSYVADPGVQYDPDNYHACTIYAGTVVQQVWDADDPEEEVLAMVVRTGLRTSMGSMVRQILSPSFVPAEKHPFLQDVLKLYAFALLLQSIIFLPYVVKAAHFGESGSDVVYRLLDCVIHAAPPGLPAMYIFISMVNITRLKMKGIRLGFPEALRLGAVATVACFDKTGTLTGSVAELHGIMPASDGQFEGLQQNAVSLTMVNKTLLAGEPMERSMFKLVEAHFLDRQTVLVPVHARFHSQQQSGRLHILRVFEFNSEVLLSGSLVTAGSPHAPTGLLFVKGAHTAVKKLLPKSSLPADFDQVVDGLSRRSFRLMAMAVGTVPKLHLLDLPRMSLQQVSAHATSFELLCLVVLTNHVRPDSKATITQLQEGGGMRTMIITGDYHHIAIAVARDVGIVAQDSRVLVVDAAKRPQSCSLQPSASAKESQRSQASSGHPQADKTIPAVPQQPACTAVRLLHAAVPSQGSGPCHTHRLEQTLGAGADWLPPKQVRWSQAMPSLSPGHTGDEEGHPGNEQSHAGDDLAPVDGEIRAGDEQGTDGDQAYPQPPADMTNPLPSVHSSAQQEASLPLPAKPIGSKAAGGVNSIANDHSQPCAGSLPLASITASHPVLQSQVAAWRPPASINPASITSAGTAPAGTTSQQPEAASLRFVTGDDDEEWDAMQALTALAEGRLQCAVTGEAFQLLLQLPDESALGTVMRTVVVFARMKPHQKGQVMNLLNARGLHHMYAGEPRHIKGLEHTVIYCGDGINDLPALSTADVGYAVGATEASIAAPAYTAQHTVAGLCNFVRESKCSQSLSLSMFKYMVGYQAISSMAGSIIFFIDGSSFSDRQLGCIDFIAMTTAIAAVAGIGPKKDLHPLRPDPQICVPSKLGVMAFGYLYGYLAVSGVMAFLLTRDWYPGSNRTPQYNPVVSACFMTVFNQLVVVSVSLIRDVRPFCSSPLRSKPFMTLMAVYWTMSIFTVIAGPFQWSNPFHLYAFPKSFRVIHLMVVLSAAFCYVVVMAFIKKAVKRWQQQQIFPT